MTFRHTTVRSPLSTRARQIASCCAVAALIPLLSASPAAASSTRLLVVGDSISQGAAGDFTWRYRTAESLRQAGADVDFVGPRKTLYNAVTAKQDGNILYVDPGFDQDHDALWGRTLTGHAPLVPGVINALPAKPNVVVVELGTNDWSLGATKALNSMRTLIAGVRQAAPGASLVIAKPYVPYSFKNKTYVNATYTADFDAGLDALATELDQPTSRIVTSDLRPGFDSATQTWDGSHPTPSGEIKIATAITTSLQAIGIGDGYHGPATATWPATGPQPTITPGAPGKITVSWSDPTPGALSYALDQRRRTAAGVSGSWVRIGTFIHTTRTWTSPVLINGDTYDYRLRPVRGVMEGATGTETSATIGANGPAPSTPTAPTSTTPNGTTPAGTTPTPAPPAPYKRPWWQWW